jgi:hypothetical protein
MKSTNKTRLLFMKKLSYSFRLATVIIIALIVSCGTFAQSFVHPGAMNTKKDLDFIKDKIKNNQEPWKSAYAGFLATKENNYQGITPKPFASLSYVAHPYSSVNCGSFNNPNVGCNDIVYDGMAAYAQALNFYITGDAAYAASSTKIIMGWCDTYKKNTESNSDLVVSWAAPWYVNAAEILRYTPNSGWTTTNTTKFNGLLNLFKSYVWSSGMDNRRNNWVMSAIEARLAIAIFQDDRTAFDKAIKNWKDRAKTYIYLKTDGDVPLSAVGDSKAQVISTWKQGSNALAFVDGLCMETCRDISHTKLGVQALLNGAEIAWSQGEDLLTAEKRRFTAFLELHSPWMMGANPPSNVCDGSLSLVSEEAFEIAYNHLNGRLGIDLPQTKKMLLRNRPNNASRWLTKWETLCYAERPFGTTNPDPCATTAAPKISITAPANNASFTVGQTISISANATSGSTISKVEFYNGTALAATDNAAPYSFSTSTLAVGTYSFTAKVYDNCNKIATSSAVNIKVNSVAVNNPPTVSFTKPLNNNSFTAPATLVVNASATDADGISNVQLFINNVLVRQESAAPYDWNHTNQDAALQNLAAGTYTLKAVATDSKGLTGEASITITITTVTTDPCLAAAAPTVSITAPANNASFNEGQNITVTAGANSGSTISKVEFYNGSTLAGSDNTAPYTFATSTLVAGTYTFTAKVFDNCAKTATS